MNSAFSHRVLGERMLLCIAEDQTLAIIRALKMYLDLIQILLSFNVCYNYKVAH